MCRGVRLRATAILLLLRSYGKMRHRPEASTQTLPPLEHEKFLRRSFEVARGSGNHPFGAILVTPSADWTNNGNR